MMKCIVTLLSLVGVLALQNMARSCDNDIDSDSLARQAKQLPDVVSIITGRFERNPPLYYQMRIARVTRELQKDPTQLPLYDDIAVAYDRLHQDDEAIAWIEKKHRLLQRLNPADKEVHEQLYRYYANAGTFWAHRWIRSGANGKRIHEMEVARDLIARGLELNPNAHFGRERYQLAAMDWIIQPPFEAGNGTDSDFSYYVEKLSARDPAQFSSSKEIEGLSGLIVLGDAWESVDVFSALARALTSSPQNWVTLSDLADLRCAELMDAGHQSLRASLDKAAAAYDPHAEALELGLWEQNQRAVETAFHRLRVEAEQWQKYRTSYMMERLRAGRHPDNDPTFWKDYHDPGPPNIDMPWRKRQFWEDSYIIGDIIAACIFTFSIVVIVAILVWIRRRAWRPRERQEEDLSGRPTLVAGDVDRPDPMYRL